LTKPISAIKNLEKKRTIPTLTIKGFIIHCTNKITNITEQRFDWENALIDAVIISAVTFFSTLGGGVVAEINSIHTVEAAIVAALSQFFVFLALKRGLIQNKEAKPHENNSTG
jgi:hypothetical protein